MFAADKARLQDKVTLRLRTVYVQLFGFVAMIMRFAASRGLRQQSSFVNTCGNSPSLDKASFPD